METNTIKAKPTNKMNIPLSILAACGPLPKLTKHRRLLSSGLSQQQSPRILHADPRLRPPARHGDWAISLAGSGYVIDLRADNRWRVTHGGISGNVSGDYSNLPDTPTETFREAGCGTSPRFTALSCSRTLSGPRKKTKKKKVKGLPVFRSRVIHSAALLFLCV